MNPLGRRLWFAGGSAIVGELKISIHDFSEKSSNYADVAFARTMQQSLLNFILCWKLGLQVEKQWKHEKIKAWYEYSMEHFASFHWISSVALGVSALWLRLQYISAKLSLLVWVWVCIGFHGLWCRHRKKKLFSQKNLVTYSLENRYILTVLLSDFSSTWKFDIPR